MDRDARKKELRGAKFAKLLNDIRLFSEFAEIANVPELRNDADVFREFAEESMRGYDATKTREENLASNCEYSIFLRKRTQLTVPQQRHCLGLVESSWRSLRLRRRCKSSPGSVQRC